MRKYIIVALLSAAMPVLGSGYKYKANIDSVRENGFCKILLSPEITAQMNGDFSDIRLYDATDKEVPYILHPETRVNERELFVEYPILEQSHNANLHYTRLVIHNPAKTAINNIVLKIKSADVRKQLKLNGSNDNKRWFVLKDNYFYNSLNSSSTSSSEIRVLDFPMSDYEYYELLIEDFYDKPINILQAGFYNHVLEQGKYTPIRPIAFTVREREKSTIIAVATNGHYIDKISFQIEAPRYYLRQAELYCVKTDVYKKRKRHYQSTLATFELISNSSNVVELDNVKEDSLFVRIENNDDAPLKIKGLRFYALNKYLTAELTANQAYYLLFCDSRALKPNYDLRYFADSIPAQLKLIIPSAPIEVTANGTVGSSNSSNLNTYWLWMAIVGVALILLYMSIKMVKENNDSTGG